MLAASLWVSQACADPASIRLAVDGLDGAGHPRLRLTTTANQPAVLQVSSDMRGWYTLTNSLVLTNRAGTTNWEASLTDAEKGADGASFYRGLGPTPPLDVILRTDPRWTVAALITTNGGNAALNLPDETRLRLTVPPFAVEGDPGLAGASKTALIPSGRSS